MVSISGETAASSLAKSLRLIGEEVSSSRVLLALLDRDRRPVGTRSWPGLDTAFEAAWSGRVSRAAEEKRPPFAGSLLCLPLLIGEVPVGALCLGREPGQTPYSAADLESVVFLTQSLPVVIKDGLDLAGQADCPILASGSHPLIGESRAFAVIQTLIERVKNSAAPGLFY